MADDLGYTPGSGATVATDEVGGRHFQAVKLAHGADGEANLVSEASPLPAQDPGGATSLLQRMLSMLQSPRGFDPSLFRQRVTAAVESLPTLGNVTTVATVTTVTTAANLTNLDGRPSSILVNHNNLTAWCACVRARIT